MERQINFLPARDETPAGQESNSYHYAPAGLEFIVRGNKGAIRLFINTNWYSREMIDNIFSGMALAKSMCEHHDFENYRSFMPHPEGLTYHYDVRAYPKPRYVDDTIRDCHCVKSGKCWSDTQCGTPWEYLDVLLKEGDQALFAMLEDDYMLTFLGEDV